MTYGPRVVLDFVRDPVDPLPVQRHHIRVPLDRMSTGVQTCTVQILALLPMSVETNCNEADCTEGLNGSRLY